VCGINYLKIGSQIIYPTSTEITLNELSEKIDAQWKVKRTNCYKWNYKTSNNILLFHKKLTNLQLILK
jgi:hypothetical protein